MTDEQKIEALKAKLASGDIKEKDHEFVESLIGFWERNSHLSKKQWYWVGRHAGLEEPKAKRKAKAPEAKPDPRFENMLEAFRSSNATSRKRIMRTLHPDQWDNAGWATELFQAVNN